MVPPKPGRKVVVTERWKLKNLIRKCGFLLRGLNFTTTLGVGLNNNQDLFSHFETDSKCLTVEKRCILYTGCPKLSFQDSGALLLVVAKRGRAIVYEGIA